MQEKLDLQSEHEQDRERLTVAQRELERQTRRAQIMPVGVQDLKDQLEVATEARPATRRAMSRQALPMPRHAPPGATR